MWSYPDEIGWSWCLTSPGIFFLDISCQIRYFPNKFHFNFGGGGGEGDVSTFLYSNGFRLYSLCLSFTWNLCLFPFHYILWFRYKRRRITLRNKKSRENRKVNVVAGTFGCSCSYPCISLLPNKSISSSIIRTNFYKLWTVSPRVSINNLCFCKNAWNLRRPNGC